MKRVASIFGARKKLPMTEAGDKIPDWAAFLRTDMEAWEEARRQAQGGTKVLMATSVSGNKIITVFEAFIAVALTARGADVSFMICDRALPVCLRANINSFDDEEVAAHGLGRKLCEACWNETKRLVAGLGLRVIRQSEAVTAVEREEAARVASAVSFEDIPRYTYEDLAIGEHALAGTLRYYGRGDLDGEPRAEKVLRRYFEASLLSMFAIRRVIDDHGIEKMMFSHGIYVPFGVFGEVGRKKKKEIVNWVVSYRKLTFIFSHGDTYHHTLMTEPVSAWEEMEWSEKREKEIVDYLWSRRSGSRDWIYFHEDPQAEIEKIVDELGVDRSKPLIGMLTNVIWDAQLHYPANAFSGIVEWAVETVRYFIQRPDLQLLIRVHPAEIRGTIPSRHKMQEVLSRAFPTLPDNVFIIPPESPISTYAALELCNAAVIYGTKMGVELTSVGAPVIVAGEAWIRGKGLTHDASRQASYRKLLDKLPFPRPLDEETVRRARKYAYHFFFRRMIPLHRIFEPQEGSVPFRVTARSLHDLARGADPGLDVICDGVLHGRPFVYDGPVSEPVGPLRERE